MNPELSIDAVCRLIDALLPRGYPVIEEVAGLLRVSPRTLQRLLTATGRRRLRTSQPGGSLEAKNPCSSLA